MDGVKRVLEGEIEREWRRDRERERGNEGRKRCTVFWLVRIIAAGICVSKHGFTTRSIFLFLSSLPCERERSSWIIQFNPITPSRSLFSFLFLTQQSAFFYEQTLYCLDISATSRRRRRSVSFLFISPCKQQQRKMSTSILTYFRRHLVLSAKSGNGTSAHPIKNLKQKSSDVKAKR